MKSAVSDTDISLVELSSLISNVQLNRFHYLLPPSVAKVNSAKTEEDVAIESNRSARKKKREDPKMVKNQQLCAGWKLRNSESWVTVFRNKTIDGPMLSRQCRPCLKYHVKGICYDDCVQKNSHCKLEGHDEFATNVYIKQLQGE